ncbi:MAG: response regulator transcription factor [Eubacteriales bacterium]|nr:response regulator transcription factor [Eubacteriales bacterium]
MYHILIVEDDKGLNHGIMLALKDTETEFYSAYTIGQAKEIRKEKEVDMVLLDVNLPDGNGFDFLREIRKTSQVPVLIITANDMEIDEVTGLSLGADDYITKPFSLMVLRARVARMRERMTRGKESGTYESERYSFSFEKMCFCVEGEEISLSKTEQKLLRLFVKNPGQTLSRERLVDVIWSDGGQFVDENALSVTVNRLRHKLEGKKGICPIQTVYGLGYVWEKEA